MIDDRNAESTSHMNKYCFFVSSIPVNSTGGAKTLKLVLVGSYGADVFVNKKYKAVYLAPAILNKEMNTEEKLENKFSRYPPLGKSILPKL